MSTLLLKGLLSIRHFPPVAHPDHAFALLAQGDAAATAEWTAGYAMTLPEHRRLVEELLAALAWGETGRAALISGLYGTGKSHLLILLHLLTALPAAWTDFLEAHPTFQRYATPLQERRLLVAHFSLDAYSPWTPLEGILTREVVRALARAKLPVPTEMTAGESRVDAWGALRDLLSGEGYGGLLLLADELSLFLAGKTPAKREADAAFLQFLAGYADRAPLWLFGALQRGLADCGPLRTHSWRQVEDRFRRYTLQPQQLGDVLREKLLQRTDPAAVRALVGNEIQPAVAHAELPLAPTELQRQWPFHPEAISLLIEVINGTLSPHRGVVEIFQRLEGSPCLQRPATRLITALDLAELILDDLRSYAGPDRLWTAFTQLERCAEQAPDAVLARQILLLLLLLHLAQRSVPVVGLRGLCFDGESAPSIAALSQHLHYLRRRCPYLAVERDTEPGAEIFLLAIDDEIGVLAQARMQEMRREFTADDPRIFERCLAACADPVWPLAACLDGVQLPVPWCGSERAVQVTMTDEPLARSYEGLLAGKAEAAVILRRPGETEDAAADLPQDAYAGVLLRWYPRPPTEAEQELWAEYAAWARVAEPLPSAPPRERRVRQRCRERAEELQPAVTTSLRCCYREGHVVTTRGEERAISGGESLAECLAGLLASGFEALFPAFPALTPLGLPSRPACQQLLAHFIETGSAQLAPQSLLADYLERYAVPLGIVQMGGDVVHLTPPAPVILDPLLAALSAGPLRSADAQVALKRPPLGLSGEQAGLAVAAAVATGVVRALDGFLQPLPREGLTFARNDALAFIDAPAPVDARFRPAILTLASYWELPSEPWAAACGQVERRLREELAAWSSHRPELRAALADWSAIAQVEPWLWSDLERRLAVLEHLCEIAAYPLEDLLNALALADGPFFPVLDAAWAGACWWRRKRTTVAILLAGPLSGDLTETIDVLRLRLASGEDCLPDLPALDAQVDAAWEMYRNAYVRWHEEIFGAESIATLRQSFEQDVFRAVKQLSRLSLPIPPAAAECLNALAQARASFCPGAFAALEHEGVCAHCRRPLGSASPMPVAETVSEQATGALQAYARLFQKSPWATEVAARLPRAPEAMAAKAGALLSWTAVEGASSLLAILDEGFIAWLNRDRPATGTRQVQQAEARLTGRDLTLMEARAILDEWLDPEHLLGEESVLAFE
ncbi:MAG TPA: DUF6079 family protein [Armatimonadota bacterium]